jgi:phosphoribosylformimino-5-aminoimidazole carboxamide ribotide isomerase
MIEIIPAIDVMNGKCVRLSQGDFSRIKTYSEDPVEVAKGYEDCGVKRIHLIDLQGAKSNSPVIFDTLLAIASKTNLLIEFGGGIKTRNSLRDALDSGADRVICGSIAATEPNVFTYWLDCFGGEKVVLGADIKENKIAIKGWKESTDKTADELIRLYLQEGLKYAVVTDISKDGMLAGPSLEMYRELGGKYPRLKIIASGGISSMQDIEDLNDINVPAAIVGKAIYEGHITIEQIREYNKSNAPADESAENTDNK